MGGDAQGLGTGACCPQPERGGVGAGAVDRLGWTIEGYFLLPISTSVRAQQGFLRPVCLCLNVSLSRRVSPHLPPRLCLGAWHTLAAVLPPPVSCPPGTLPPLVYRGWKNPLASRRPECPWGGEETGTGVGMLREGQPWGAVPGGRRRGPGCVRVGVSSWGPGQAWDTSHSHMPRAVPAPGRSSGGPLLPHPGYCQSLQGTLGTAPTEATIFIFPPPPQPCLNSKCVWAPPRACTCPLWEGKAPSAHLCAERCPSACRCDPGHTGTGPWRWAEEDGTVLTA